LIPTTSLIRAKYFNFSAEIPDSPPWFDSPEANQWGAKGINAEKLSSIDLHPYMNIDANQTIEDKPPHGLISKKSLGGRKAEIPVNFP
jgi:hypothetical protein